MRYREAKKNVNRQALLGFPTQSISIRIATKVSLRFRQILENTLRLLKWVYLERAPFPTQSCTSIIFYILYIK